RRVDVAVKDLKAAKSVRGQTEQSGEETHFHHYPEDRGGGGFPDRWAILRAPGIEPHDSCGVGDGLDARESEDDADEGLPVVHDTSVQRLELSDRDAQMRQTKSAEYNHDQRRRNRNEKGEAACMFRTEQVEQADGQNRRRRESLRMCQAKILESGERADRGRHQI